MRKEPIALYIFRFIFGFGLFAFMCMLYWSSVLIEEDMKGVERQLKEISHQVALLKNEGFAVRDIPKTTELKNSPARPHINPELPNLLQEDPFYDDTLPAMLGPSFHPYGVFREATVGKPNNLHPFNNWREISDWRSQCTVAIAKNLFGKYETLSPYMAIKMEERKNPKTGTTEFWIHLRDDVYWSPLNPDFFSEEIKLAPQFLKKHPVTAYDFKFYFDAVMNPHVQEPGAVSLRTYIGDIEEIEVIDPLTFVVRWKAVMVGNIPKIKYAAKFYTAGLLPLPCFVYQYYPDGSKIIEEDHDVNIYRKDSVFAQQFTQHWAKNVIVSCGPWVFDGLTDRNIKFKRNPDFYYPYFALTERKETSFKDAIETIWQDFKANYIDIYNLQSQQELDLENFLESPQYEIQKEKRAAIERLNFLERAYAYIGWNEAKPLFASKKARLAMTMAIDRERIIRQNLQGNAIEVTGPFFYNSPSYNHDVQPWPFDPTGARMLLEEEGWYDSDGDGIIDKVIEGVKVPFRFKLTYFVKSSTTKAICEYIATALREIGVDCQLSGVDLPDLTLLFDDKSFDAYVMAWALGSPPEDPKQLWYSQGAKEKGSSNAVGFVNKEADRIIDRLQYEANYAKRLELYHRFHEIIHEEQPYTFLYTPKRALLYREYVQNVFLPSDRQKLIPGADIEEPQESIFWLKPTY